MAGSHVAILLGTKDGARFLAEQLASYRRQIHADWSLVASDDGSQDGTVAILEDFRDRVPQAVQIRRGPEAGHCANFMALARDASIAADYYAYSDQDDIWLDDKLARAIARLGALDPARPALYCSRTELVDETGTRVIGHSPLFTREPSFANALVQNIGGGNTMLFNAAAKRLLEKTSREVVAHDWWTYQIVTAAGGTAIYDPVPYIRYRQHQKNVVGSNRGWIARAARLSMLLEGQFAEWNEVNINALRAMSANVSNENLEHLAMFDCARRGSRIHRVNILRRSKVYRQTLLGNLALYAAAATSKL